MRRQETLQEFDVLVVDVLQIIERKKVCLFLVHISCLKRNVIGIDFFVGILDRLAAFLAFRSACVGAFGRSRAATSSAARTELDAVSDDLGSVLFLALALPASRL